LSAITPEILLKAYAVGIFPMAENASDNALYWVEPDERGIFPLDGLHVSASLRKAVRKQAFEIRVDHDFTLVMQECARKTTDRSSTWINKRIVSLYTQLHKLGCAHSVECWQGGKLVGGLYGVSYGRAFFGESMFSRAPNASKVALVHLVARLNAGGYRLLDAQFINPHLVTLGAIAVPKAEYKSLLAVAIEDEGNFQCFNSDDDAEVVLNLAMRGPSQSSGSSSPI
jgi:leucyl/phenylalanyl-tRNA---protein transferase